MSRSETIWDRAGSSPYLVRVFLSPRLRLHVFLRGDADPDCHDHPSDFWTFPLVAYVEEFINRKGERERRVVRAWRPHFRRAEFAHRLLGAWDGSRIGRARLPFYSSHAVVTLVLWEKKRREWGFYAPAGWVTWKRYHGLDDVAQPQSESVP